MPLLSLLLAAGIAAAGESQTLLAPAGNVFTRISALEASQRRSGALSAAVAGTVMAAAPFLSSATNNDTRVIFGIFGALALGRAARQYFVPRDMELVAARYATLAPAEPQGSHASARATARLYEDSFLLETREATRVNRVWDGVFLMGTGAAMGVGGLLQGDQAFRTVYLISGGFAIVGGIQLLASRSELERTIESELVRRRIESASAYRTRLLPFLAKDDAGVGFGVAVRAAFPSG